MRIREVTDYMGHAYVSGPVERGDLFNNDVIQILGIRETQSTTAANVVKDMIPGDAMVFDIGVALVDIKPYQVEKGQVVCQPYCIAAYTDFDAKVDILSSDAGGRDIASGDTLQFHFRTIDVPGSCELSGAGKLLAGESGTMSVSLDTSIAMEEGTEIEIREDGAKVGSGSVSAVKK